MRWIIIIALLILSLKGWSLEIESEAFPDGGDIPSKYTCDSFDYSPPLVFKDIPPQTKSFVLICDDPDAPLGTWVHWVIFNIPREMTYLEENLPKRGRLQGGILQGINDFRRIGYGGPCPPPGKPHRYFFKLFALDKFLTLKEGSTKEEVLRAMEGNVLEKAELIGLYSR